MTFRKWVSCIRTCYLDGRSNQLKQPLGKWLVNPNMSESYWTAYIDHTYSFLITQTLDVLHIYSNVHRKTSCTTILDATTFVLIDTIPNNYFPVHISFNQQDIIADHAKQRITLSPSVPTTLSDNLVDAISNSADWKRHMLQHFHLHDLDEF